MERSNDQALQAQVSKKGGNDKWRGKNWKRKDKPSKHSDGGSSSSNDHSKSNKDHSENSKGSYSQKGGKKKHWKKNVKCFNCNRYGHFADECRSNSSQNKRSDNEAQMAQDGDSDSDPMVLMVATNSEPGTSETWYLDFGCSNHMTSHKEWLVDLDESKKSKVRFSDNRSVPAEGIGDL